LENTFGRDLIPQNEEERLENLKNYKILYTQSETKFDQLSALTASMFNTPIAMINFVDKDQVWTKSTQGGHDNEAVERGSSLCSLAILKDSVTVFEDALAEPILLSNPMVAGEFGLRFYAAAPIKTSEGFNVGAVCIIDTASRDFSEEDQKKLEWIADLIRIEMESRKKIS